MGRGDGEIAMNKSQSILKSEQVTAKTTQLSFNQKYVQNLEYQQDLNEYLSDKLQSVSFKGQMANQIHIFIQKAQVSAAKSAGV